VSLVIHSTTNINPLSDHDAREQTFLFRFTLITNDRSQASVTDLQYSTSIRSINLVDDKHTPASRGTFLILLDCLHGPRLTCLHPLLGDKSHNVYLVEPEQKTMNHQIDNDSLESRVLLCCTRGLTTAARVQHSSFNVR